MITKEKLVECGQLLTYEEWYRINEIVFTTTNNSFNPKELYDEYVEEIIKNFPKTPLTNQLKYDII